jgi:hypothetical protein
MNENRGIYYMFCVKHATCLGVLSNNALTCDPPSHHPLFLLINISKAISPPPPPTLEDVKHTNTGKETKALIMFIS